MYTNEYQMYNYINFYNDGRINKLKQKTKNPQKFYVFVIRKRLARVTHIYLFASSCDQSQCAKLTCMTGRD